MAQETLISPGVLTRENDLSQITQNPVTVGLALVGPTVTGPVNVPTVVTSYSDFKNKFGGLFTSGGANYEFLTSITARNYFQQGGTTALITRVTDETYTSATSSLIPNNVTGGTNTKASASMVLTDAMFNSWNKSFIFDMGSQDNIIIVASNATFTNQFAGQTYYYIDATPDGGTTWNADNFGVSASEFINNTSLSNQLSASYNTSTNVFSVTASSAGTALNNTNWYGGQDWYYNIQQFPSQSVFGGGSVASSTIPTFVLETLSTGFIMNNSGSILSDGSLASGSNMNVRWEVQNTDTSSGTFTLLVRQGDDNDNSKTVLETFSNLSLDPNQPNYLEAVIGNQRKLAIKDADGQYYIQTIGDYANNSRYVRVSQVNYTTPNYFDNAGNAKNEYTASIPVNGSGSEGGAFGGAAGNDLASIGDTLFNNIGSTTQGLLQGSYVTASALLSNKDEFDFALLATPGLIQSLHSSAVGSFISLAENRGDCFYITDLSPYNVTLKTVTNQAAGLDTNYAGAYWPWVQVISQETGKRVWVPASTIMPGVYAFNDNVSAEWFAPAGLTRGGLGNVLQAERKLSPTDRDNLYAGKVNPISTFPNIGVAAFGQKTLQKKASALDRINVRRLLIALKRYIGNVAENLVFEQNTATTRNAFINTVTPYLESVQQRQGLYAFRVVMDDTNNTPDVIDRNQLVGQIYLQPTRTAEFILLDFNILPTGVEFGS
jgi:phage tail sheath protein FI